jgi:hypothetical protein
MSKTPYEIRTDLIREARQILQARAKSEAEMPTTEQVIAEAQKLNDFVSSKRDHSSR